MCRMENALVAVGDDLDDLVDLVDLVDLTGLRGVPLVFDLGDEGAMVNVLW